MNDLQQSHFWRAEADRRKIALQEANRGIMRLRRQIDRLKREKATAERLLGNLQILLHEATTELDRIKAGQAAQVEYYPPAGLPG